MDGRRLTLTVTDDLAGRTVDTLLRRELGLSGTAIKHAKTTPGGILLDGLPAGTGIGTAAGQILSVFIGDRDMGGILSSDGKPDIVYEDEDLLIVNKAAGTAVHPGPGHYNSTLGNIITGYYKTQGITAAFHPVNRLDRGTSGLMVVAKHAHAQERMIRQLHASTFRRIYLAVCEGMPKPPAGIVDAPIARMEGSAIKRQVSPVGAPAITHYEVLETSGGRSLVRLELETGRTHQIRVHMAHIGHPLTGDFLYGTEDRAAIARTALHSAELALLHPITGARIVMSAPLPEDMKRLLFHKADEPASRCAR